MWAYWLMFFIAAMGVAMPAKLPQAQSRWMWRVLGLLFAIIIGLRHQVGGDWFNYLPHFEYASTLTFSEAAGMEDPGHYVLNRLVAGSGGSIYIINFIYASILMCGTVVFCRRQPNPSLAFLVAVPYMLIVVGMGYTRQSVALGFALLGLVALGEGRVRSFIIWVSLGALFHKSAVLLLPISALASSRNRLLTGVMVVLASVLMYYLLLEKSMETIWTNYIDADMQSEGGAIRVAMNAFPAVLLFLFRRRLLTDSRQRNLWLWVAAFSLVCIPLVGMASTAIDRVALYFIPLQLFVFSRLPGLASTASSRKRLVFWIVVYYAAVQFVWLNFATHAQYWLPYQFMPLT